MTVERTGWFEGSRKRRLFFRSRELADARGCLLAVHGLGDHSGRYDRVAECAAVAGLDFHALDMRGHGRSEGRRGHARALDDLLGDVDRLRLRTEGRGTRRPTVLLGHSLGGLVVGRYVQEYGFPALAGAVLVAPFVDVVIEPPRWKALAGAVADRLLPGLTLDNEIRAAMLFRDESEARAWEDDPLVHHRISARLWGEMQRQSKVLVRRAPQCRTPMLIQLPGRDVVVSSEAAGGLLASRLAGDVRLASYPDACHDLYHDPSAGEAAADLVRWLGEAVQAG